MRWRARDGTVASGDGSTQCRTESVAGARVLVVEDAEAIQVAVKAGLTSAGYAVLSKPDEQTLERDLRGCAAPGAAGCDDRAG
jgi:hypothetical protein